MKKAIGLFELIVSLVIFGVILYTLYVLMSSSVVVFDTKKKSNQINQELLSTKLAIQNRVLNGRNFTLFGNKIDFFELEHQALELDIYSGFAELDHNLTSKSQIKTTIFSYTANYPLFIGFDESVYEIESINPNLIILKDKINSKKFSENYFLYKNSKLSCQSNKLFEGDSILLENVESCKFDLREGLLLIDICVLVDDEKVCRKWEFMI